MSKKQLVLDVVLAVEEVRAFISNAKSKGIQAEFSVENDQDIVTLTYDAQNEQAVREFLIKEYDGTLEDDTEYLNDIMESATDI